MKRILTGREPKALYERFEDLTRIPRGSGNEKGVADYLVAFAEKKGLSVYRDALHNVLIRRPADPGKENRPAVILQGHSDMVCEKLEGVEHDFLKDPLDLVVEGKMLRARGTTLGADDGVAVAIMLALLEEENLNAPMLECFFTTQEETGMDGALGFDYSHLTGRRLINLDSGTPSVATVSCAGSCICETFSEMKRSPWQEELLFVSLTGLAGGHSGTGIHKGNANAILFLASLLKKAQEKAPFRLVSFSGGGKTNAIPREAKALLAAKDRAGLESAILAGFAEKKKSLSTEDQEAVLSFASAEAAPAFSEADTAAFLKMLFLAPNGVKRFVPSNPGMVQTSSNLGVAETEENGVRLFFMPRSSKEEDLDEMIALIRENAAICRAEMKVLDRHPGWDYAEKSPLRDQYIKVHRALYGKEPKIVGVHAGLECGIIGKMLGGVDSLSFGPIHTGIHTPDEKLDLDSFAECYRLVKALLEAL